MSFVLLIGRLFLGLAFTAHGAQKLFGSFGGPGLGGTAGFMNSVGFRPGRPWAVCLGLTELCGGLLTTLGLFHPLGPALIIPVMTVAALVVHKPNGFFAQDDGVELTMAYIVMALLLAVGGPGILSLDAIFGTGPRGPLLTGLILLGAVLGGFLPLLLRRPDNDS